MTQPQQLGFGFDEMLREQETAHLPGAMDEAIPYYRGLIEKHHAAMISGDIERVRAIKKEAHELAVKLNDGDAGIMANFDSPAYLLARGTAAPDGTVPLWGQTGHYVIDVDGMKVRVKQEGMFGIGSHFGFWPGFATYAVDYQKPFLSETGHRSFLGCHADVAPGITPEIYADQMIRAYVQREAKGKLRKIERGYVEREMTRRAESKQEEPAL